MNEKAEGEYTIFSKNVNDAFYLSMHEVSRGTCGSLSTEPCATFVAHDERKLIYHCVCDLECTIRLMYQYAALDIESRILNVRGPNTMNCCALRDAHGNVRWETSPCPRINTIRLNRFRAPRRHLQFLPLLGGNLKRILRPFRAHAKVCAILPFFNLFLTQTTSGSS